MASQSSWKCEVSASKAANTAETAGAARIRHHGVEDAVVDLGVVIAAEDFAGGAAARVTVIRGKEKRNRECPGLWRAARLWRLLLKNVWIAESSTVFPGAGVVSVMVA